MKDKKRRGESGKCEWKSHSLPKIWVGPIE